MWGGELKKEEEASAIVSFILYFVVVRKEKFVKNNTDAKLRGARRYTIENCFVSIRLKGSISDSICFSSPTPCCWLFFSYLIAPEKKSRIDGCV